ncbi:hypothetical protein CEXT_551421 [Caerostris extrusa]|uniref:Uncharacterized protein n=1 Tax=Caerostris extrusa TaxID=172846 RepID=A0AAV4UP16_CAEEX|nr:hypothetical protein CEXT_551421 [Caerostris extrusa]
MDTVRTWVPRNRKSKTSTPPSPKRPANGFRVNVCYGAPGLCSQKEGGGVLYRILTIKIPPTPHKEKGDHTWLQSTSYSQQNGKQQPHMNFVYAKAETACLWLKNRLEERDRDPSNETEPRVLSKLRLKHSAHVNKYIRRERDRAPASETEPTFLSLLGLKHLGVSVYKRVIAQSARASNHPCPSFFAAFQSPPPPPQHPGADGVSSGGGAITVVFTLFSTSAEGEDCSGDRARTKGRLVFWWLARVIPVTRMF